MRIGIAVALHGVRKLAFAEARLASPDLDASIIVWWERLNSPGGRKPPHSILMSPALEVRKLACASTAADANHALACAARSR